MDIAICDDEKMIGIQLRGMLELAIAELMAPVAIDLFQSGETFWVAYQKKSYDLIFLDVNLGNMNGLEISRKIRQEQADHRTKIVIITAREDHRADTFGIQYVEFLVKPLQLSQVQATFWRVVEMIEGDGQFFAFSMDQKTYQIPNYQIICFETRGRKIALTARDGEYLYKGKIGDLASRLDEKYFWQISQSCWINTRQVSLFQYEQVTMVNGQICMISQAYRPKIREKVHQLGAGKK